LEAVQFQAVRAAVEQRLGPVDQGSPHEFKSLTVAIAKTCDYCGESVGGFGRKAARCALCEYTCHTKCQLKVEPSCTGADSDAKRGFLSMFGSKRGRRASKSQHRRSMSAVSGDSAASSSFDNIAQQHQLPQARMSMLPMPANSAGIDPAAAVPSMMRTPQATALSMTRTNRSDSVGSGSHSSISNSNSNSNYTSNTYGGGIAATNGGAWQRMPIPVTASATTAKPSEDSELVPVLYDFEGDGSRTLTVNAGDRVRVVEPDSEGSGWIEIAVPSNGQQGLVPTSYVDMATYRKPSLPSLPPRQRQPNAMPASALPVLPTLPPGRIDSHSNSNSKPQGSDAAEYVVALYDFTARDD
ncbi:Protein BZZ1, partial [Coemansia sp. RSA 2399]